MKILPLALFIIPFLAGCGANNTPPQTPIPGEKTSAKLRTLETGAAAIQSRPPVDAISTYLDGFHFYSGDKNGQMEAHHYVTVLNEDVMQAVIYDGNPSLPPPKRQRMVMMSPMRMRLSLLLAGAKDLKDWWLNLKHKVWD